MQKSAFFNSRDGDRRYKAEEFAEYFASFIGNGVFPNPSTGLQVFSNNDMSVTVNAGKAWINGYFYVAGDQVLSIAIADGILSRIDRVVVRWSLTDREITLVVKQGAFASNPVAPTIQRDADVFELALADIAVNRGATSILQMNITDLRLNPDLCGIVTGLVHQVDTSTLAAQLEDWFANLQTTTQQDFDDIKEQFEALYNTSIAQFIRVTTEGTGSAYTVTTDPMGDLIAGASLIVRFHVDSTITTPTLNYNGTGEKPIRRLRASDNTVVVGYTTAWLSSSRIYQLIYDGIYWIVQSASQADWNDMANKPTFEALPRGVITMWSGTIVSIPSGWALCDGNNGTPNLVDRFIIGAGNLYNQDSTGGEANKTLTVSNLPSHTHTGTTSDPASDLTLTTKSSAPTSGTGIGSNLVSNNSAYIYTWSMNVTLNHTHSYTTNATGSGESFSILPPYYALAYIMKL